MKRSVITLCILLILISMSAREALAVDILEIRVKRLYQEAQAAADRGDYAAAMESYNKAISYAKDKDIKQFLINARKELQRKRREKKGAVELPPPAPMQGKMEAWPQAGREVSAEERDQALKLEKERADLDAERKKLDEERAKLEEEKRKRESIRQADIEKRKAEFAAAEKARLDEEKARLEEERTKLEAEKTKLEDEELVNLEKRKEREAKDRALYESSNYRRQVKEILAGVRDKLKDVSAKAKEQELSKKIETKTNKLSELDQKAEEYMSQGEYEKAKAVYEEILTMSKDKDLQEYIKMQKGE